jgi:hypothetical protein
MSKNKGPDEESSERGEPSSELSELEEEFEQGWEPEQHQDSEDERNWWDSDKEGAIFRLRMHINICIYQSAIGRPFFIYFPSEHDWKPKTACQ